MTDTAATIYAAERPAPVVKELPRTNVTRKCGVCGDFASSVITFYRRNPFEITPPGDPPSTTAAVVTLPPRKVLNERQGMAARRDAGRGSRRGDGDSA